MDPPAQSVPIIALCGAMGAGKDTLAAELCREHGYQVWRYAGALREALALITGIPAEETTSGADKAVSLAGRRFAAETLLDGIRAAVGLVAGDAAPPGAAEAMFQVLTGEPFAAGATVALPHTVGRLLQLLGTECFRELVGEDVWTDSLYRRWEAHGRPSIVIADARFPNETAAARRRGGVVMRIRRTAGRSDGRSTAHASERGLDGEEPDALVENEGTPGDLLAAAKAHWPRLTALAAERGVPTRRGGK